MISFFHTTVYTPLYNILVLILNIDWVDAGIAAILLTLIVKIVLYPLAKKATITQIKMKEKESELLSIRKEYKDKQEQALKTMEFYKKNNISPFSSIVVLFIQIPIIYSLYYIFFKAGLPTIDKDLLYSFVPVPNEVSMNFLGLIDISEKSLLFAALASAATYFQIHISSGQTDKNQDKKLFSVGKEDFSRIMAKQMKYTMPVIVFIVSWQISGVVALYWFVSSLFSIAQDLYVKKRYSS